MPAQITISTWLFILLLVIAVGAIQDPVFAEEVLARGKQFTYEGVYRTVQGRDEIDSRPGKKAAAPMSSILTIVHHPV